MKNQTNKIVTRTPDDRIVTASSEYRERLETVRNQMAHIGDLLQSQTVAQELDPLNWGFSGNMKNVKEYLKAIEDFLEAK